ncbi:hypothetical protein PM082_016228 [Marasmius tenuissimus]|nr:hypothetical protein PM082_016228 [Marasmius tenuissimus]
MASEEASHSAPDLNDKSVRLDYKLPALVDDMKVSWQLTLQSSAVVSSLFAALAVSIIQTYKGDDNFPTTALAQGLSIISYGAVLLNASTTVTSLILIDKLGGMGKRCAGRNNEAPATGYLAESNNRRILKEYRIERLWYLYFAHWFLSLSLGIFCIFLQVLLYVIIAEESLAVYISTIVIFTIVLLPPVFLVGEQFCPGRNNM